MFKITDNSISSYSCYPWLQDSYIESSEVLLTLEKILTFRFASASSRSHDDLLKARSAGCRFHPKWIKLYFQHFSTQKMSQLNGCVHQNLRK